MIYRFIILNVIVMNDCMSIMKDVSFYYIECNCYAWSYKYYEGSTVVIILNKIVTNGCRSTTKIYCCIILNVNYHE
jgi:hypothetical protein